MMSANKRVVTTIAAGTDLSRGTCITAYRCLRPHSRRHRVIVMAKYITNGSPSNYCLTLEECLAIAKPIIYGGTE